MKILVEINSDRSPFDVETKKDSLFNPLTSENQLKTFVSHYSRKNYFFHETV